MEKLVGFDNLPPEIKAEVISHVDIRDIAHVRVAGKVYRVAADDWKVWDRVASRIEFAIPQDIAKDKYYETVKAHVIEIETEAKRLTEVMPELRGILDEKG